jgi:hypothetical protein
MIGSRGLASLQLGSASDGLFGTPTLPSPLGTPISTLCPDRRDAMNNSYRIVVGVDDSEGDERVLRWAVHEAARLGGTPCQSRGEIAE